MTPFFITHQPSTIITITITPSQTQTAYNIYTLPIIHIDTAWHFHSFSFYIEQMETIRTHRIMMMMRWLWWDGLLFFYFYFFFFIIIIFIVSSWVRERKRACNWFIIFKEIINSFNVYIYEYFELFLFFFFWLR